MLYTNFTEKLIGLQDLIVTELKATQTSIIIYTEIKRKPHHCPCCNKITDKIDDYRIQTIKDIHAFGKTVTIVLRKRRYCCPHCGKQFFEQNNFLSRYYRNTSHLNAFILDRLRNECSFSSVSREVNLSVTTVIRRFYLIQHKCFKLPRVLSIHEFKDNTGGEKYQCILTDPTMGHIRYISQSL